MLVLSGIGKMESLLQVHKDRRMKSVEAAGKKLAQLLTGFLQGWKSSILPGLRVCKWKMLTSIKQVEYQVYLL